MEQMTGVERPRATNPLAIAIVAAGLAAFSATSNAAAQCVPAWDRDFITAGGALFFGSLASGVQAFVEFDDGNGMALYVAGNFNTIEGVPASGGFAGWDGQNWTGLGLGSTDFTPGAMTVFDDGSGPAIYVGGAFTTIGGVAANQVARYDDVNDTWLPLGDGVEFTGQNGVVKLIVFDEELYAIGSTGDGFNNWAGIERWDGAQWHTVSVGTGSGIILGGANDAVVLGNHLYIGGSRASFGGRVIKWDGEFFEIVGSHIGSNVLSLAAFQDTLFAGTFCAPNGTDIGNCVHRWDGNLDWSAAFGSEPFVIERPSPGPAVRVLHVDDDPATGEPTLFVGGNIFKAAPDTAVSIVKFDGAEWSRLPIGVWRGSFLGQVVSIFGYNDGSGYSVYVGGRFSDGQTEGDPQGTFLSPGIARWGCADAISPGPPHPDTSQLFVSASIISGFGGQTSITVTPRDANDNLLPDGRDVVINATAGALLGSVDDLGDGTYAQQLEAAPTEAGATVTATVDGVALTASATVTFVPVDPVASTIDVDVDQTFEGGSAIVTVIPADDAGFPVGAGFEVVISTTHGDLTGSVSDNGDGTYTQTILATSAGTANITATVDGLPLDSSASLSVLDPANYGDIVGINAAGDVVAFLSIQEAVDSGLISDVFVVAGTYEETIQIDARAGLSIIGLPTMAPVVVRGFVISDSESISIRHIHIDASSGPHDAVRLRGGPRSSDGVEIIDCTITGATKNGVTIDRDNANVLIEDSVITGNGRNGIEAHLAGGLYTVRNCSITANGYNGVALGRDVVILLEQNVIAGNGLADGQGGGRWGINRQRKPQSGTPEQVTLIQNVIEDNNGKPKQGIADEKINNYDQIIDETDDQPPYTD